MIAVVQRVSQSEVAVNGKSTGRIDEGLLVLLGVGQNDQEKNADYLADKIIHLRIFEDDAGKMNRSLLDINGQMLIVSQFTLLGDCRKGRRPSFIKAAPPDMANELYLYFVEQVRQSGIVTQTGVFGAMMDVSLINHGPVTMILESA
ncbi:MAG: D-tyrosyl-tRNA(Tyr) deacylase [Candidatus Magnetoglobus multicellularis str. Araruama]|uniref:D-aminoacyl-tRNA deacylase n=1 Tax=Candidatus Magnetoglobus multicellularis str. Araruama TaxID=890399 RepID=A0A1V1P028_9BACT|nr:MAG: D-tyrosyl-tRNA(Tyr) deacylase [Candidatus Magnetoglobus multicellularis str. Araruama]